MAKAADSGTGAVPNAVAAALLATVLVVTATVVAGAHGSSPVDAQQPSQSSDAGSPAVEVTSLRSVADWESLFVQSYEADRERDRAWSTSADSWDHYSLAYTIDSLTAAYRATDDPYYLDEAFTLVESMIDSAELSSALPGSQYGDRYLGWLSGRQLTGGEIPLFESYAWRYVTTLLRVIRESPEAYDVPAVRARYEAVLAFTETHVFEKWHERGAEANIYRSRTHMASHWALIGLNLSVLSADPERRDVYREVVASVDTDLPNYPSSLRGQLVGTVNPDAYFWSDQWGERGGRGQDVAHGNAVIAYVVEAQAEGEVWTDRDMERFVNTFDDVIWRADGSASEYLDGSGEGTGWFSDGFVKLGRYDAALQLRLEGHVTANGQFYANGALNARLLGAMELTRFGGHPDLGRLARGRGPDGPTEQVLAGVPGAGRGAGASQRQDDRGDRARPEDQRHHARQLGQGRPG